MTVDESGAAFVYVTYALVGSIGFEPTTPTMSRWCSNQLSYEPEEERLYEVPADLASIFCSATILQAPQPLRDARWTPPTSPSSTQARWICAEFDTSTVNCMYAA